MIQLAYNSTPHTTTGFSPFELTYGQNVPTPTTLSSSSDAVPAARELASDIADIVSKTRNLILEKQEQQARYYNQRRVTSKLSQNNLVLLDRDGIKHDVSEKYSHKFLGPFRVKEVLDRDNYKLDLPAYMKIHSTIHISKLYKYFESFSELQRSKTRPPAVGIEDPDEFKVERVLRERRKGKHHQYLVKWVGYDATEATWVDSSAMDGARKIVLAWKKRSGKR